MKQKWKVGSLIYDKVYNHLLLILKKSSQSGVVDLYSFKYNNLDCEYVECIEDDKEYEIIS